VTFGVGLPASAGGKRSLPAGVAGDGQRHEEDLASEVEWIRQPARRCSVEPACRGVGSGTLQTA